MNTTTEFDVAPLTWVKSEIDLALERANQALDLYTDSVSGGIGDLTQIKFCRAHLHQVHGALTIIGLDGVTQFAQALESLLEAIERQTRPAGETSIELAHRALSSIGHYLDDLINGQPNQPLRLLTLYQEVQEARGSAHYSATDLFYPDLSVRPPRRTGMTSKLSTEAFRQCIRQERMRFQRGLLAWLLNSQDRSGIAQMLDAVKRIEETQEAPSARSFWWVASAYLSALAEDGLPQEKAVKQICARIDQQIRRLYEGSRNVAERLMRDTLYFIAQANSSNDEVARVKTAYRLPEAMPSGESVPPPPKEALRRKLRDIIAATEEAWNKFCSGTHQSLPLFKEHAGALASAAEQLGHTDFRRLAQAIAFAANWLAEDNTRHSETVAMEIATAILLTQNAQENFLHLGNDFAHQVDVTVARIHGCIAGSPPQPSSEIPLLDEMSRKAQEKLLIVQVAKEIQNNLAQIEQALDTFFRDPEKRGDLANLDSPLRQIAGALTIMGHDSAVAALNECAAEIKRFADPDYTPTESDFEQVADRLSLIGFFIDTLQHGAADFDAFVRKMQNEPEPERETATENRPEIECADEQRLADEATEIEHEPRASVEQEIELQKDQAHALLDTFRSIPDDPVLREKIGQTLQALQKDAEIVADTSLAEQVKAMLSTLGAGTHTLQDIERTMSALKPRLAESSAPSAETIELSQSSADVIDAELLAIFLEEANEVLDTIEENLLALTNEPHDVETLTTIRRSFHTLKGSGRMVGLKDVGEAAWAVEQMLNLWLRKELEVTAEVLALIDQAHIVFAAWVRHLESGTGLAPNPSEMMARADALRLGKEETQEAPAAPATSEPTAEAPAQLTEEAAPETEEIALQPLEEGFPEAEETIVLPDEAPVHELAATQEKETPLRSAEIITLNFPPIAPEAPSPIVEATSAIADEPNEAPPTAQAESEQGATIEAEKTWPESTAGIETPAEAPHESVPVERPATEAPPAKEGKTVISPVLFEIFSEEARSHLATLQRELPVLEAEEVSPTPHEMYRAAHTLAGISATVGITSINRLGLALEHALLRRDHSTQPGSLEALGKLREAIGQIELLLSALAEQRDPVVPFGLIEALDAAYPAPSIELSPSEKADETTSEAPPLSEDKASQTQTEDALPTTPAQAMRPGPLLIETKLAMDEIDEQLLPIFLEEAQEICQDITSQLRSWRHSSDNTEAVAMLARQLHTLKGSARMAGAMKLGEIAHAIETYVSEATRTGPATPEVIDEIDNAFDTVQQIIERLQSGETGEKPAETAEEDSTIIKAAPEKSPTAIDDTTPTLQSERAATHEADTTDQQAQRATIRIRADLVDRLVNEAGELSIARARIEGEMRGLKTSLLDLTENVIRLRRQLRDIEIQAETQMQSRTAQADVHHAGFDPLEFDRFTRFQELTRMMAESVNDVATVQQNLLKNLDDANAAILAQARMNRELQQELMSVRMVPFASLSDRLYRIVRQTSKELNKRANLDIAGGQVELDRSVLDKMVAPLEHMLRNSIAHGLEEREQRVAQGKPDIGEISLSARQEGNEVIITLSDDGAGLDLERIKTHAVEIGLLDADEDVAPERLADMIFAPGFSTASEVSHIAGRGVGMDVVKTEVASLGGHIETLSTPGKGTEFRLYIPLTLAVTKALLVRVGNRSYAIPSVMIEQVLDLKEAELTRIRDAGQAEWMNNVYPFNYLPHLLGDPGALPEQHRQYWVLLLRSGTRRIAVQVDELMGNREIVVKNIGPQLARIIGIDGATVLGDGQVVLILNPVSLSTRAQAFEHAVPVPTQAQTTEGKTAAAHLPTVLIVDDSLTVRKITGRLLAREGYQVLAAKDGVEALEILIDVIPDVMLVDIEMPRLDGFDLTRNIRADERLKSIPIIMITSRTADKHRNYAFEIGVNHYLGKPYQEDELLQLVSQYVSQRQFA